MTRKLATQTLALQIVLVVLAGCSETQREDTGRVYPSPSPTVNTAPEPVPASSASVITSNARLTPDPNVDHAALGREAWEAGRPDEAAIHLGAAIELGTATDYDRYLLGLAQWKTGQLAEAEATLSDAAWAMDTFVRAPLNLARVRLELGDVKGARTAIDAALALDAELAQVHNVLGRVLLAEGDHQSAIEAFRRASELDPNDAWPLNNAGYALLIAGDSAAALGPLEAAVAKNDTHAVAWHNLALARERMDDDAGALAAARRAAELSGDNTPAAFTLARLETGIVPEATGTARLDDALPIQDDTTGALDQDIDASVEQTADVARIR